MTKRLLSTALLGGFALLAFASASSAQTHPCDTVGATTVQSNAPVAVGVCILPKDADGVTVPIASFASFRVTIDGTTVFTGPLTPIGTPSATGLYYFETAKNITVAKGQHTVVSYASNDGGESVGSDPFVFTLKSVPPGKGKVQAVVK